MGDTSAARTDFATDYTSEDACPEDEFSAGLIASSDRDAELSPAPGTRTITLLESYWLFSRCVVCRHTFRIGDHVSLNDAEEVVHDGELVCGVGGADHDDALDAQGIVAEFFQGLDATWPPPRGMQVVRLTACHPLLSPATSGFHRHECAVCGHSLRAGDQVIVCPCNGAAPRCMTAIHRDPIRGFYCWDDWNAGKKAPHCPMTRQPIR